MRRAFTLLELIIVVAIIGLVAGVGSVFVREYGQQRNAGLTQQKIEAVKTGLLRVEKDEPVWYAGGFVADCGTFPPELSALLNENGSNVTLIHADESNVTRSGLLTKGLLLRDVKEIGGRLMPAPFLEDNGTDLPTLDDTARIGLYGGYAGPYAESLGDGWGRAMEFNGSAAFAYGEGAIVSIVSAGADRRFASESDSPVKAEFDEFLDTETEKAAYADDIAEPLPQRAFRPESLEFDLSLEGNASDCNRTAVIVYTPMLYYIEETNCTFDATGTLTTNRYQEATCNGTAKPWQIFSPEGGAPSGSATYAVGVAKYVFTMEANSTTGLYINEQGIDTGSPSDLNETAFVRDFRVTFNDGGPWSFASSSDSNRSFYLFGGQKSVVLLKYDGSWKHVDSFPWVFKPGRREMIRYER